MKKVTKLVSSFSLLLLFITGCAKKNTQIDQASIEVDHTALITPSPYVQRQLVAGVEQHKHASQAPVHERVLTTKELFQEIEARFDDLSIPFGFAPTVCRRDEQGFFIEGSTGQLLEDCMQVCQQDMERFGWERGLSIATEPVLMVYTKPGCSCAYRITARKASWFSKKSGAVLEVWYTTTR